MVLQTLRSCIWYPIDAGSCQTAMYLTLVDASPRVPSQTTSGLLPLSGVFDWWATGPVDCSKWMTGAMEFLPDSLFHKAFEQCSAITVAIRVAADLAGCHSRMRGALRDSIAPQTQILVALLVAYYNRQSLFTGSYSMLSVLLVRCFSPSRNDRRLHDMICTTVSLVLLFHLRLLALPVTLRQLLNSSFITGTFRCLCLPTIADLL